MASAALKVSSVEPVTPAVRVVQPTVRPRVSPHPHTLHDLCAGAVEAALTRITRRFRLTADDADDLRSELWLKITARQGQLIRRFRAQATLETYLTSVAHHLLLDLRNRSWGRWRPCRAARQLGPLGVRFDRMVRRDGMTLDEAECWFRTTYPASDWSQLASLRKQLPQSPRRTFVPAESMDQHCAERPVDLPANAEAGRDRRRALTVLRQALRSLPPADRRLLIRRYAEGTTVASLAGDRPGDAKPLYRRCERLLRTLRQALERGGVTRESVVAWLGSPTDDGWAS